MIALLNCPFCGSGGGSLSVSTWDVQPDGWWSGHVSCGECDAQGAAPGEWLDSADEAELAAAEAWNRRAPTPPPRSEAEAVQEADAEGWVLVPTNPTEAMIQAGWAHLTERPVVALRAYAAMISASPASPSVGGLNSSVDLRAEARASSPTSDLNCVTSSPAVQGEPESGAGAWRVKDWLEAEYLDGIRSRYSVQASGDRPVAYAFKADEARLLAAAPKLLAALKELSHRVERAWPSLTTQPNTRQARAAIALAERDADGLKAGGE